MKTKRKLLAGLTPGTEEYIIKHHEWRKSRGKLNPSEGLKKIKNGTEYYTPMPGNESWVKKHNEYMRLTFRPIQKFASINNPKRSLIIAQRHQEQFKLNPEKAHDKEYEDQIIESVEIHGNNCYSVTGDCGSLFVKTDKVIPKAGDVARYYGQGFGSVVRGVDIEGIEVRYQSERQLLLRYKKESMKSEREQKNDFLKDEKMIDAMFANLPLIFQERIERFRKNSMNFRWKHEISEILLIEESLRIAKFIHTQIPLFNKVGIDEVHPQLQYAYNEEVTKLCDMYSDYSEDEILKLIPDFIGGHSGNTWAFVFRMAFYYLTDKNTIPYSHGAFSWINGCLEYGCHRKFSKKEKKQMVKLVKVETESKSLLDVLELTLS